MNLLSPHSFHGREDRSAQARRLMRTWRPRANAAFTLVEIALCLGIIAFALVAIMGVMPTGLKVQKENREETIINQDGALLMEAIRSGARGLDYLTNHVQLIRIDRGRPGAGATEYRYSPQMTGANFLTNGEHIVGLLSSPKLKLYDDGNRMLVDETNRVRAVIRAISGNAGESSPNYRDMAFKYYLLCEVVPYTNLPTQLLQQRFPSEYYVHSRSLLMNLHEVRLTLRWPVIDVDTDGNPVRIGRNRRTFRTLVSGDLIKTNGLWFFNSSQFFNPTQLTQLD